MLENEEDRIKADDQTVSRLASIGQMSAGIAHEIRNPLTSVKGFLQLLQEEAPHRYIDVAFSELERAIATVQDLLQVSKPDLDTEHYQPIFLCPEIESLLNLFQQDMYRVKVTTEFQDEQQPVYGKLNQLKKAFFNLFKNAFEAIEADGEIHIRHVLKDRCVRVEIKDSGSGIDYKYKNLLGTPFFSTKESGTGMGLTQVYSSLYQHGATINVDSALGQGTNFTIDFPIHQPERAGGIVMETNYTSGQTLRTFIASNRETFYVSLIQHAPHTFEYIRSLGADRESLFTIIDEVLTYLLEERRIELLALGKRLGRDAAKSDHPLAHIMELTEGLRAAIWDFCYAYHKHQALDAEEVFQLERRINKALDAYAGHYFTNYLAVKDEIVRAQREAIEDLSVPVIPLNRTQAILPIVGTIDTYRAKRIQERTLQQVAKLQVQHIIIDLSAVAFMDTSVVAHLFRIVDGIHLLGCKTTVTGIRPEVANTMVTLGVSLDGRVETVSTLAQALSQAN